MVYSSNLYTIGKSHVSSKTFDYNDYLDTILYFIQTSFLFLAQHFQNRAVYSQVYNPKCIGRPYWKTSFCNLAYAA